MLSNFVNANQSNWDVLLPYVMMAYRGSVQSSTKYTPYEAVFGHQIVLPVDVLMDQCGESHATVDEYVHNVRERLRTVGAAIQRHQQVASQSQKEFYDLRVSHQYYEPGERVWVRDKRRRRGQCPKLMKRFVGPYVVIERMSDVLYRLRGDNGNTVVHFNRLKPCYDSDFRLGPVDLNEGNTQNSQDVEVLSTSQDGEQRTWCPNGTRPRPPPPARKGRNRHLVSSAPRPAAGGRPQPPPRVNPSLEGRGCQSSTPPANPVPPSLDGMNFFSATLPSTGQVETGYSCPSSQVLPNSSRILPNPPVSPLPRADLDPVGQNPVQPPDGRGPAHVFLAV